MVKLRTVLVLLIFLRVSLPAQEADLSTARAQVFLAESPSSVRLGRVDAVVVRRMVDAVVMAAAGRYDIASAWRIWVKPGDRVGIKVSTSGAPVSSTHPAVVAAVAEGLVAAGIDPSSIVIWDRSWETITRAGYGPLGQRFSVVSTDRVGGYSPKETVTAAVIGKLIVGDLEFDRAKRGDQMSGKSHISRVLTEGVDKVVHVPALTDHVAAGLGGALTGMVLDNLDNWRRLARPPHFGDAYLPELYSDPRLGGKVVLTIMDALRPQFAGGPFPGAEYIVNHGAILASRDAVAIDAVGLEILDNFRREAGMPMLAKQTGWLSSAEMIGLGVGTRDRIDVIDVRAISTPAAQP
jgi:uncharacterized protein (DUF362 family)